MCKLRYLLAGRLYNSIARHNQLLFDYSKGESERSEGLQVLGLGEPWPIFLEGMEECYLLEPLVIRGLSHSVNLGITFLQKN